MIEGMLVAAWAVGANSAYLYLRDEYPEIPASLRTELAAVTAAGLAPHPAVDLRTVAGARRCGGDSGIVVATNGTTGTPRPRSPPVQAPPLLGRANLAPNE